MQKDPSDASNNGYVCISKQHTQKLSIETVAEPLLAIVMICAVWLMLMKVMSEGFRMLLWLSPAIVICPAVAFLVFIIIARKVEDISVRSEIIHDIIFFSFVPVVLYALMAQMLWDEWCSFYMLFPYLAVCIYGTTKITRKTFMQRKIERGEYIPL